MKIKKILNNNVAVVYDEAEKESVVIGKGIAYGKKAGDVIADGTGFKIYKSVGEGLAKNLAQIVDDIPFEHIKATNEIIVMAREHLDKVDDKILLSLADHISFAIKRHFEGIDFADSLWELQKLYPQEYQVGLSALEIIEKRLGISLPNGEASFIAFHLVNAGGGNQEVSYKHLELVKGILEIVKSHFAIEFDEESYDFVRFMTHLRFFAGRAFSQVDGSLVKNKESPWLQQALKDLVEEGKCVETIAAFVQTKFERDITADEKSYLMLHIHRVV